MYSVGMARTIEDIGSLFLAGIRPAIRSKGARETNASNECSAVASGTPCPACAPLDGQMVHAHCDVREEDSNEATANNIESVMAIVEPPGGGDKEGYRSGQESENHQ